MDVLDVVVVVVFVTVLLNEAYNSSKTRHNYDKSLVEEISVRERLIC